MLSPQAIQKERVRKDKVRRAIGLAMLSRWSEAVAVNRTILVDSPNDLEAYNRLGKAYAELGRNVEAKTAFQQALDISPSNGIAKKNLDRLLLLGDIGPRAIGKRNIASKVFIEESGKTGVTLLTKLASRNVLLALAPGHPVELTLDSGRLNVGTLSGDYVGQIEPRLSSRLVRLLRRGNRYEAAVTSVGEQEVTVIIRETYKHPSQTSGISFPPRVGSGYRENLQIGSMDDGDSEIKDSMTFKDWSSDDTEPGDDEAFSHVVHRVVDSMDMNGDTDD